MTDENLTSYEMMLIVDPTLGDDRTHEVIEDLKKAIKDLEGVITFEDFWGTRYLSYKIKRHDKGYYVVLNFNLAPTKLLGLSNDLILNQSVIRFITLKTPKNYEVMTLEALEKDAEKFKKVRKEEKPEEVKEERKTYTPKAKPVEAKVEKKVEKEEVKEKPVKVEEVEVEEEAPVKEEPKKKEPKITDLDDVDAKLKSIIDDPDISL